MIVHLNSQNFSYTRMATSLNSKLSKRSVFSKPLPNKIPLQTRQNSQGNIQHLSYELQHYMLVIHTCNSHILHRQNTHNMSNYVQMYMVENACNCDMHVNAAKHAQCNYTQMHDCDMHVNNMQSHTSKCNSHIVHKQNMHAVCNLSINGYGKNACK